MNHPVEPHGGTLVDRLVAPDEVPALLQKAERAPRLTLDARELADLELIATGAASPLRGFLGSADYAAVLDGMRLADGTVWPLPFTLAVPAEIATALAPGRTAALTDPAGRLWGVIEIEEIFRRSPLAEARAVYRTADPAHPGVAYLLGRPETLVAGPVQVLPLPALPFARYRLTPRALRDEIAARGWRKVAGFQTRNPIHRAHEHLTKLALEVTDGLVIHPLVGETKGDDVPAEVRFLAYQALVDRYYPKERTLLAAFPAAMRYAGPREALFHAVARKNYGITHLIVGRDHAGVGKYYGPYESQQIFDRFTPEEIGVQPLRFEPTFHCRACGNLASSRTCEHDAAFRVDLSGTKVREILRSGGQLPVEFSRPEVAEVLRAHYLGEGATTPPTPPAQATPPKPRGFILWFTGLSGAGKTTLARALRPKLANGRTVEILDGDEVRDYLSKGLGFSRADRDTNIRRIGYVARLLARNGVSAITSAISPYAETRAEVKKLARADGIEFVEIFAHARLESLIARDVKGLYQKAIAGEVQHFTGISDPYEAPEAPDLVVHTDRDSIEESVGQILDLLGKRGLAAHQA